MNKQSIKSVLYIFTVFCYFKKMNDAEVEVCIMSLNTVSNYRPNILVTILVTACKYKHKDFFGVQGPISLFEMV